MAKPVLVIFILFFNISFGQKVSSDTLFLNDEINDIQYAVKSEDYFRQLQLNLPDSISRFVISFIANTQDSIIQGIRKVNKIDCLYYLSMDFYERDLYGLTFDHILYDLFVSGKLHLIKNERIYSIDQVKIKARRFYCCHNPFLYCGKEWIISDKKNKLTSFCKSTTSKMYVIRSCF